MAIYNTKEKEAANIKYEKVRYSIIVCTHIQQLSKALFQTNEYISEAAALLEEKKKRHEALLNVGSPDVDTVETTAIASVNGHVVHFAIGASVNGEMERGRCFCQYY